MAQSLRIIILMNDQPFSLFYQAAPPRSVLTEKLPLLLLLHGYGSNEDDLLSLAPYLDERFLVVSARAPVPLAITSYPSYAWFSLEFGPGGVFIDEAEVESSRQKLRKFIDELVKHYQLDLGSVYLLGFSQGAMMSLAVALTYPTTARAVVAMSGRLLPQTVAQISDKDALTGLPIFVAHGTGDTLLPIHHGRETRAKLSELPVELTYREYEMGHEVTSESLRDITTWLTSKIDARG
jgi:phospholipase/carboxylesterase